MPHRFVVMIQGQLCEFTDFDDIPSEIDNVIEFAPEIPPPPHTDAQHDEIEAWGKRFDELMERELCRRQQEKVMQTCHTVVAII